MGLFGLEREPIKAQRTERHLIGLVAYGGELGAPENFHRRHALHLSQVQLHVLRKARKIRDHKHGLLLIAAKEREHLAVGGPQKLQRSAPQRLKLLALLDQVLSPP